MQNYVKFPVKEDGTIDQFAILKSEQRLSEIVQGLTATTRKAMDEGDSPLGFIQKIMDATKPETPEQVALITYLATKGWSDLVEGNNLLERARFLHNS